MTFRRLGKIRCIHRLVGVQYPWVSIKATEEAREKRWVSSYRAVQCTTIVYRCIINYSNSISINDKTPKMGANYQTMMPEACTCNQLRIKTCIRVHLPQSNSPKWTWMVRHDPGNVKTLSSLYKHSISMELLNLSSLKLYTSKTLS